LRTFSSYILPDSCEFIGKMDGEALSNVMLCQVFLAKYLRDFSHVSARGYPILSNIVNNQLVFALCGHFDGKPFNGRCFTLIEKY